LGRAFDTTTKEGKQAVRDWLSYEVLIHKLQNGDLGVQIAKSLSAQVEKKVVKEVYNGQPKTVNRADKVNLDSKDLSPAQRDLLSRGLPLPSQQIKV
jgi:signal recognition particle GTPase